MASPTFGRTIGGGNPEPHGPLDTGASGSMGYEGGATGGKVWGPQMQARKGAFGMDVQGPNAMVGGITKDGTTEMGAQANLIGGGVTYDSPERSARFGLGLGWGGGGRVHHGEKQGFGLDVGPFSMDYKSKTFGETMGRMADSMDPTKNPMGWSG